MCIHQALCIPEFVYILLTCTCVGSIMSSEESDRVTYTSFYECQAKNLNGDLVSKMVLDILMMSC
jgi:hypothetical protein